jgi:DNA-binding helix-hairpin-helix protein with protein kinase domain
MHKQFFHCCDLVMTLIFITLINVQSLPKHIVLMLVYQAQWANKIQTPSIPKFHDGNDWKWGVGTWNDAQT